LIAIVQSWRVENISLSISNFGRVVLEEHQLDLVEDEKYLRKFEEQAAP
jgi:hypothetical protein